MKLSRIVLIATTLGALVHLRWCLERLPERIATHFGPGGVADGFGSRDGFLWTGLALIASFALLAVLIGWLLRVLPDSMINVPHREYWLSGERREASLRRLRGGMEWFGVLGVLFSAGINHSILRSNRLAENAEAARIGGDFYLLLGGFILATIVWIVLLVRSFSAPRTNAGGPDDPAGPGALEPK